MDFLMGFWHFDYTFYGWFIIFIILFKIFVTLFLLPFFFIYYFCLGVYKLICLIVMSMDGKKA